MYAACASAGRGARPVSLVRLTRSGPHPPARLCRPPFFKQKLRPVSGRRYSFLYILIPLHHLLQHTIICSSDYGEGPSELTRHSHMHLHSAAASPARRFLRRRPARLSALQLGSDIRKTSTFSLGLAPSPIRSCLFNVNLLSPSKSLVAYSILRAFYSFFAVKSIESRQKSDI